MNKQEFWHDLWRSNRIGFNQSEPNALLKHYFSQLSLKSGARILVPLCGKSVDMLWLVEQGYDVIGVELSPIACEAFFQENNLAYAVTKNSDYTIFKGKNIILLSGDFFQLTKNMVGEINAVYDRAALIALPADLRQRYADYLIQLLEPNTPIFLITMSYNHNEMEGPPFSVDENEVKVLYKEHFQIQQFFKQPINEVAQHLRVRGLTKVFEEGYFLL